MMCMSARKCFWMGLLSLLLCACTPLSKHARPPTVAVWDFDNASFIDAANVDYLSRTLQEMLLSNLAQAPDIQLVERVRLREALEEQRLGSSELVSEDNRIKLGRILGAKYMVFGNYIAMEDKVRLDVRLVEVETSLVKLSEDATTPLDQIAPKVQALARHIAAQLGASPFSGTGGPGETSAWKHYGQGIALMDKHRYDEAIAVFKELLKTYPTFKAAERQIQLALERQARE